LKLKKPIVTILLIALISTISVHVVGAENNSTSKAHMMTQEEGKKFNLSPEEVEKYNKDGYLIRLSKKAKESGVTAEVHHINP